MPVAIVGWGHTKFGRLDSLSLEELITAAAREALSDAGVVGRDVDAVFLGHFNAGMVPDGFCASMVLAADPHLRFKPATRLENACASGSAAVYAAIDAIESGRARIALVVGAEKMTHLGNADVTRALGAASYQKEEAGLSFPEIFARFAQAYGARYGDPTEAMARIAVKNHENALDNPLAQMHRPLDLEFCLHPSEKNPVIAAPLKKTDCSLVSDGAAALVLCSSEMVGDFRRAVGFRGTAHINDLLPLSAKDLTRMEGPERAFHWAHKRAGVTVNDISFAEVHDCFTIAELMVMEAMGLAGPGEASALVKQGVTTKSGRLPINCSGGLKAKGHPIGATGVSMHVIAARQLVGEAGEMQLRRPELGLCFNMGGGAVASYVSILEPLKV
ncbi:acetyl-CoA acetyltransferase [Rhizobiaceae bacterium n13]|uniref:Acetyl-CoA acetyltransferase n=1 Tax=Ferirhizobium litorale TaxID=2927786 RepID=A0AAE3QF94_9HYPH|nr:acetyl-CoA acetyltransferase [Fererhizobium litorale]MDI7862870.1 acetyl-CoA acetyltransferase [Fererhizobium litorale]MDI7923956.1 acetyl-CoA acetyltransferase [Fererhizobium litorale]